MTTLEDVKCLTVIFYDSANQYDSVVAASVILSKNKEHHLEAITLRKDEMIGQPVHRILLEHQSAQELLGTLQSHFSDEYDVIRNDDEMHVVVNVPSVLEKAGLTSCGPK